MRGGEVGLVEGEFQKTTGRVVVVVLGCSGFLVLHQGSAVADLIPHSESTTGPWCSVTYKGLLQPMRLVLTVGK